MTPWKREHYTLMKVV